MKIKIQGLKISSKNDVILTIDNFNQEFKSLALVGSSGSGKTTLIKTLLEDLDDDMSYDGKIELFNDDGTIYNINKQLGVIPQNPLLSLDPYQKIGKQIQANLDLKGDHRNVVKFLEDNRLDTKVINFYPAQLSGGQAQRIIVGLAFLGNPKLIIADEPTSSMDQEAIDNFIKRIVMYLSDGGRLIFTSHNQLLVSKIASDKFYLEDTDTVYNNSIIQNHKMDNSKSNIPIVKIFDLSKVIEKRSLFRKSKKVLFDHANAEIMTNSITSVVGENGIGKTTLEEMILGLQQPSSGSIELHEKAGIVFQNSITALDPTYDVLDVLKEVTNTTIENYESLLLKVGLDTVDLHQKVTQLSGGQAQRLCIARTILQEAKIIFFDESFSSLDIVTKQNVIKLLLDLKSKEHLTYVFITHDPIIINLSDTVLEIKNRKIVQI